MAKKALFTVLSAKARDGEIVAMEALNFPEAKTKQAALLFASLARQDKLSRITKGRGALVVLAKRDDMARRAMRNLPFVGIDMARNLNARGVLQYKYMVMPVSAIKLLFSPAT